MAPSRVTATRARQSPTLPWSALHDRRAADSAVQAAQPLPRMHGPSYHRPYLLDQPDAVQRLLAWFDHKQHDRLMPWRQAWIDPNEDAPESTRVKRARSHKTGTHRSAHNIVQEQIQRRAYEVWISEIMLQQTRVETARSYWLKWIEAWPSIDALADASVDDVLAAWRGLGYYGRARRIHEAAQKIMHDPSMKGQWPEYAHELCEKIPGVGPYTAGAISSIVFGHAVPILDGNVARVLSRQTGLYADPRSKSTNDLLWYMARMLVEHVAPNHRSDVPGRWNQGLMELGSTLCTPTRPACDTCPIQSTCAVYAESILYERAPVSSPVAQSTTIRSDPSDIEDTCSWCQAVPDPADSPNSATDPQVAPTKNPRSTKSKLKSSPKSTPKRALTQTTLWGCPADDKLDRSCESDSTLSSSSALLRAKYIQLFPMRAAKQAPRVESRVVCIVRTTSLSSATPVFLLHQRPDTGLLAKLWEFPTVVVSPPGDQSTDNAKEGEGDNCDNRVNHTQGDIEVYKQQALSFVASLRPPAAKSVPDPSDNKHVTITARLQVDHIQPLGFVRHEFSHLHWHMHVLLVDVTVEGRGTCSSTDNGAEMDGHTQQWRTAHEVEAASMGTGLRRCWSLVQQRT